MTGADRENLLKAHEAAASFAHRAANDAKRTREILEGELSTLRAQLAEAECALGGFCKPPFDGSLVTGIKAISMRCAGAESERDSLKRQLGEAGRIIGCVIHDLRLEIHPTAKQPTRGFISILAGRVEREAAALTAPAERCECPGGPTINLHGLDSLCICCGKPSGRG